MANFEFETTAIPSQYSINLKDNFGILWIDAKTADLFRTMFSAIADTLKFNQSKDAKRIGMTMKDDKGNFKLGAILTFKQPEEGSEEDSGNWYLEFTFDAEDMGELDIELDNHSDIFIRCASEEAQNICYGRFRSTDMMFNLFNCAIDTLVQYLDTAANEATEETNVSLRGIFTATVGVEDGKKVMSIVPGEYIKQIVKNDSAL